MAIIAIVLFLFTIHKKTNVDLCVKNIRLLGIGIKSCPTGSGKYFTTDEWCDMLVEKLKVNKDRFTCRYENRGKSDFAINPNSNWEYPSDIVLLFETKTGWNQSGGKEILSTENHNGLGCHVLFNDLTVKFIKTENLDKLRWKP